MKTGILATELTNVFYYLGLVNIVDMSGNTGTPLFPHFTVHAIPGVAFNLVNLG